MKTEIKTKSKQKNIIALAILFIMSFGQMAFAQQNNSTELTVVWVDIDATYTGLDYVLTTPPTFKNGEDSVEANDLGGTLSYTYSSIGADNQLTALDGEKPKNAGNYSVTAVLTPSVNKNMRAGTYTLDQTTATKTFTINKAQLTIKLENEVSTTVVTLSKPFDGTTVAQVITVGELDGFENSETLDTTKELSATANYSHPNAIDQVNESYNDILKTITVAYSLKDMKASTSADIEGSSRDGSVVVADISKNYLMPKDVVITSKEGAVIEITQKQLYLTKAVAITDSTTGAKITKEYDGNTTVTTALTYGELSEKEPTQGGNSESFNPELADGDATAKSLITGLTLTATAEYANKDVNTSEEADSGKTITVTYGLEVAQGSNVIPSNFIAPAEDNTTLKGNITPKALTITAEITGITKEYDGTATIDASQITFGELSGLIDGELVEATPTATYEETTFTVNTTETTIAAKAIGSNKNVKIVYALTDGKKDDDKPLNVQRTTTTTIISSNYTLADDTSLKGSITQKQLTIAAPTYKSATAQSADTISASNPITKVYDGFNTVTGEFTAGELTGKVSEEAVTIDKTAATYNDKTAGDDKVVTITYTINGDDVANYLAPEPTIIGAEQESEGFAKITKKPLTTSTAATFTVEKAYDGNTTAAIEKVGVLTAEQVIKDDDVTLVSSANYADATVGTSKKITTTYTLTGTDADNYTAPVAVESSTDGIITTVEKITIDAAAINAGSLLQEAINEMTNGTITLSGGTIELDKPLLIKKNVTIIGSTDTANPTIITTGKTTWGNSDLTGGSATLIDINNHLAVDADADKAFAVTLENITVMGAKTLAQTGGGFTAYGNGIIVYCAQGVTLNNIVSKDNAAAGVIINNSIVAINNITTSNNAMNAGIYLMQGAELVTGDTSGKTKVIRISTELNLTGNNNIGDFYQIISSLEPKTGDTTTDTTTDAAKVLTVTVPTSYKSYKIATGVTTDATTDANRVLTVNVPASYKSYKIATDLTGNPLNTYKNLWSEVEVLAVDWKTANAPAENKQISKVYTAKAIEFTTPTFIDITTGNATTATIDAKNLVYSYTAKAAVAKAADDKAADENAPVVSTTVAPINVGEHTVSVAYAAKDAKFKFIANTNNLEITQAQLKIAAPALTKSKVYDKTTTAAVVAGKLINVLGKDKVTANATAEYTSKGVITGTTTETKSTDAVGTGKVITVTYTISGADAANYIAPVVDATEKAGVITTKFITKPTAIVLYSNGLAQTGVKVDYPAGYELVNDSTSIEQTDVNTYSSVFELTDKVNTAWEDKKTDNVTVAWAIKTIVKAEITPAIWVNGDAAKKIKPTVMKESVKAGTSSMIDFADKLTFTYIDPKTGKASEKALKYKVTGVTLAEGFKTAGTIAAAGNKIKFTPNAFYYTPKFDIKANSPEVGYEGSAVEFDYTIEVDFNGMTYPATFKGYIAVEPVNQAPRISKNEAMSFFKIGDTNFTTTVTVPNLKVTIDAGPGGESAATHAQATTVTTLATKGLSEIKLTKGSDNDHTLSFKIDEALLAITKPTVVTVNFTVTDTDSPTFGGSKPKAMTSKGSIKVTLLPTEWKVNAVPTFAINEDDVTSFDQNTKAAAYKIAGLITTISDGGNEADKTLGKQKVTFTITTNSDVSFTKLPTIAVKGKTDGTGTGDLMFTLAANVNKDVEIKITAHDNGMPIASSTTVVAYIIKVKPEAPSVKSFKIVAKGEKSNEVAPVVSIGDVEKIKALSADVAFAGRNVTVTSCTWTLNQEKSVVVTADNLADFALNDTTLKAGDKVTLEIAFKDDGATTAAQTGTWTGTFFLGSSEWFPAINLMTLNDVVGTEGTYQVSMTQGKIKNKVITSVSTDIPYIKVSEFIASKAKGFLPNAVVTITQIDKFNNNKFTPIYKENKKDVDVPVIEFITTDYANTPAVVFTLDKTTFYNGVFSSEIEFTNAQGFTYELVTTETISDKKSATKKIQNGTITFSDADLRKIVDAETEFYTVNSSHKYTFTHSFTLPKVTTNDVKIMIKVKPINPLFNSKTFTNETNAVAATFATMPTAAVNFTTANADDIFPYTVEKEEETATPVVLGPVSDVKNAKYNVTLSWPSIQNADSYTVEYRTVNAKKWTKKNVKKLTSLVLPLVKGEYEWQIITTTKVETEVKGKAKVSSKTEIFYCGLFNVVTLENFRKSVTGQQQTLTDAEANELAELEEWAKILEAAEKQ